MEFRTLSEKEELEFRQWARANYKVRNNIPGIWPPVIQDECVKMNREATLKPNPIQKCPDCGKPIIKVLVERFEHRKFIVDHEKKTITPEPGSSWEFNDSAFHCAECDSLNVDDMMQGYLDVRGYPSLWE